MESYCRYDLPLETLEYLTRKGRFTVLHPNIIVVLTRSLVIDKVYDTEV